MNRESVFGRIVETEERLQLLRHTVSGWSVWPILRKAVADGLTGDFAGAAVKTARLRPLWGEALRDMRRLAFLGTAPVLVKTFVSGLLDQTPDGRLRDIWFDDIIQNHSRAVKLEGINNRAFLPRRTDALIPANASTVSLDLLSRALSRVAKPVEVVEAARALQSVILAEFNGVLSLHTVTAMLNNFYWQRRFYSALLSRVKPQVVLTADFGEYALVAAASERRIASLEIQHGIVDRFHPAYSWPGDATRYRQQMPIPSRLVLYGDYWKEGLSRTAFWNGGLEVVGSTRIDRHRQIPRSKFEGIYRLLITADGIDSDATVGIVRELLDCSEKIPLKVILKLHPVYTAFDSDIRRAFAGDARVVVQGGAEGDSTLRILRDVDLHASIGSASHYDALGLGTPTVIIGTRPHDAVVHLQRSGHAGLVLTGRDLRNALQSAPRTGVPDAVSDFYFRSGALTNIMEVLRDVTQSSSNWVA